MSFVFVWYWLKVTLEARPSEVIIEEGRERGKWNRRGRVIERERVRKEERNEIKRGKWILRKRV